MTKKTARPGFRVTIRPTVRGRKPWKAIVAWDQVYKSWDDRTYDSVHENAEEFYGKTVAVVAKAASDFIANKRSCEIHSKILDEFRTGQATVVEILA